jgi:hypothetical protein
MIESPLSDASYAEPAITINSHGLQNRKESFSISRHAAAPSRCYCFIQRCGSVNAQVWIATVWRFRREKANVLAGKGDTYREVALNAEAREALASRLRPGAGGRDRRPQAPQDDPALQSIQRAGPGRGDGKLARGVLSAGTRLYRATGSLIAVSIFASRTSKAY